jgi:hypothetical protein
MTVLLQEDQRGIQISTQVAELRDYDQISSVENRYDPLPQTPVTLALPLPLPFLDP